jgi:hypothetical protein
MRCQPEGAVEPLGEHEITLIRLAKAVVTALGFEFLRDHSLLWHVADGKVVSPVVGIAF